MGPWGGLLRVQKLVVDFRTETYPGFTFKFRIISWWLANRLLRPAVLILWEEVWAINPPAVLKKVLSWKTSWTIVGNVKASRDMSPGFRIRHFLYFGNSVGDESMESGPLTLDVGQDCGGIWPVSNLAGHHIQFFLDGLTHSHCHYSGLKFQSWSRERSDWSEPCLSKNEGTMIVMTLCFKSPVGGSTKGNLWGVSKDVDLESLSTRRFWFTDGDRKSRFRFAYQRACAEVFDEKSQTWERVVCRPCCFRGRRRSMASNSAVNL